MSLRKNLILVVFLGIFDGRENLGAVNNTSGYLFIFKLVRCERIQVKVEICKIVCLESGEARSLWAYSGVRPVGWWGAYSSGLARVTGRDMLYLAMVLARSTGRA